jgi:16S rRNA (cytidine1402-2'-O)-methyltransferase
VGLAVCATPIGNLEDVTLRVLGELAAAELVLCEDTRHTRVLLERHGVRAARGALLSYHQHNEAKRVGEVLPRLLAGQRVALVSDAGLPGVNDPGARLVRAALEAGVPVSVLPGPSAVETALVASGLVGEQYRFVGWLPRRVKELRALWEELAAWPHPVVGFESPRRVGATLRSLAAVAPRREVAVCRELTKRFEEVVRGEAADVAALVGDGVKGEVTLVIGPAEAETRGGAGLASRAAVVAGESREARLVRAQAAVGRLVEAGCPRRVAVDVVADLCAVPRNELYRSSL